MKSILFAIIFSLFFAFPAYSGEDNTKKVIDTFDSILKCQASIKITSYYIDIYQSVRVNLDNLKPSESATLMVTKMKKDWARLEKLASKLKVYLAQRNFPVEQMETTAYVKYQQVMLMAMVQGSAEKNLLSSFTFINDCISNIDKTDLKIGTDSNEPSNDS